MVAIDWRPPRCVTSTMAATTTRRETSLKHLKSQELLRQSTLTIRSVPAVRSGSSCRRAVRLGNSRRPGVRSRSSQRPDVRSGSSRRPSVRSGSSRRPGQFPPFFRTDPAVALVVREFWSFLGDCSKGLGGFWGLKASQHWSGTRDPKTAKSS